MTMEETIKHLEAQDGTTMAGTRILDLHGVTTLPQAAEQTTTMLGAQMILRRTIIPVVAILGVTTRAQATISNLETPGELATLQIRTIVQVGPMLGETVIISRVGPIGEQTGRTTTSRRATPGVKTTLGETPKTSQTTTIRAGIILQPMTTPLPGRTRIISN